MKNIILLTIDSLRKDVLGCYGDQCGLSPFIDSIQEKSIRFTKAHSIGPYTQAAFPGILTSSYYLEYGRQKMLSSKRVLISEVLKKAGITTAAFHSNPYLSGYFQWNRGWDFFYDSMQDEVDNKVPYIKAKAINQKVAAWLPLHFTRPFFLWIHYMDVHEPYVPEKKYIDLVDPTLHVNMDDMMKLFSEVLLKRDTSDPNMVKVLKTLYRAHVREVDDSVRDIFDKLKEWDVLNDTLVMITSDHGDEFGEHGGLSHDGKMFSELVNIPLILYDPSREKGMECDLLVSNIDIPPTIVHLFGLESVAKFEGSSLFPLPNYPNNGVLGEAVEKFGRHEKGDEMEVHYYREGDIKIIYHERNNSWELYDLASDPKERENIIETHTAAIAMKNKIMDRVGRYKN